MKLALNIQSFVLLSMLGILFLAGCGSQGDGLGGVSPTTGWNYNDPENGGFEVVTEHEQEPGPGLVHIEGGTFTMGRTQEDMMYTWDNEPRKVTVNSFYMDQTEIRNVDYREYLNWLQRVFVDNPEVYENALPDTLVWRDEMAYNEPYVDYYFRHPSYNNYPVVGVSWVQATDYCVWRTDRVNERRLVEEGILEMDTEQIGQENFNTEAYLAGKYEGTVNENLPSIDPEEETRRVRMSDGILLPQYRLPTEAEWEYAALGYIGNTYEENVYQRRMYPWDGHNVRNSEKKNRGKMMANFKRGKGDMMGVAGDLNDNASITAPVNSYWPNDYGLYCMAGNVNEWVQDVYRPSTHEIANDFSPFRGNVFTEYEKNEDGSLAPRNELGRLPRDTISEEDAAGRENYSKGDYRNYREGDQRSRIDYDSEENGEENSTQQMYREESSLISDESRVYKGGSWKDRAYWLNPAERRFMDQNKSANHLGFRCAMTHVGSPEGVNE
ncbi:MAG: SUMF1/EgtB/PvdO family nonheme iron enzyme [Bacteroidota bacterium]